MRNTSVIVALTLLAPFAAAQTTCVPMGTNAITVTQDSIQGPFAIGFAFPFGGTTYTDISISDHLCCWLSNGGVPATPTPAPLVYTPDPNSMVAQAGPMLCPMWSDTIPGTTGMFYLDTNSAGTETTITWFEVRSFGIPTPLFTVQMVLNINGEISFHYDPWVTNNSTFGGISDNGVVGVSEGMTSLPPGVDFSTSPVVTTDTVFEQFVVANTFDMGNGSIQMIPTNPGWVVLYTANGVGCATLEQYGAACDGLNLSANNPVVGMSWDLTTTGLHPTSAVGFTFFAFGREIPPIPMTQLGFNAPGCDVHLPLGAIITQIVGVAANNQITASVQIPPTGFLGVMMTAQTVAFTANNPAGLATSNAVEGTWGN